MSNTKRFTDELDYSVRGGRARVNAVGDILYEDGELNKIIKDYFDEEFNILEEDEVLSHEDEMCIELEKMANYILNGGDSEEVMKDYHIQNKRDGRSIL